MHLGTIVVGMAGEMILSRCFALYSCTSGAGGTLPSPRPGIVFLFLPPEKSHVAKVFETIAIFRMASSLASGTKGTNAGLKLGNLHVLMPVPCRPLPFALGLPVWSLPSTGAQDVLCTGRCANWSTLKLLTGSLSAIPGWPRA